MLRFLKMETDTRFEFTLSNEETQIAIKSIRISKCSNQNNRRYFSSDFTKLLTNHLVRMEILCFLSSKYNWLRNSVGSRPNSFFWRGKYICKLCCSTFIFTIQDGSEKSENFEIGY